MNLRYVCEHQVLRDAFYKNPIKVISKFLTEREGYIYDMFLKTFESNHEAFPYQKKDFFVEIESKNELEYIVITMPSIFIEPTLCHKIIIAYSMQLDLYQYFTVEDGNDPLFGKYQCLCTWIENNHIALANIKENDESFILLDKINDIMMIN